MQTRTLTLPPSIGSTAVPGLLWPPVPNTRSALLHALMGDLVANQWQDPEVLQERQNLQIASLLEHAYETCPFYGPRLEAAGYTPGEDSRSASWSRIPLLTRRELRDHANDMQSRDLHPAHGTTRQVTTSGSTGSPVTVTTTQVCGLLWEAQTVFEHLLHGRRFSEKQVYIKFMENPGQAIAPYGANLGNWGAPVNLVYPTGPSVKLTVETPVKKQAKLLLREDPGYVLSHPSNLAALARHFASRRRRPEHLLQLRTLGETLTPDVRRLCREVFDVGVTDVYSCQELGNMAMQCPEHEHYHVTTENVLLEILDDQGRPCAPGETGRVVVTALTNLAQPLIRYDIGDLAVPGEPCPCGRSHPVLAQVLGRVRNMLQLPSGDQLWPRIRIQFFAEATGAPIEQVQIVQKERDHIEVRLAPIKGLKPQQEASIRQILHEALGHPFEVSFCYLKEIPRSKGGKYEDFRCEIPSPR